MPPDIDWRKLVEGAPPGLQGLLLQLLQINERQQWMKNTPLAKHFWPDADLQYVFQPAPNWYLGGALTNIASPKLGVGIAYQKKF